MRMPPRLTPLLLAAGLACAHAQTPADDKRQALHDFMDVYGVQEVWPQLTAKVARDSLPRLQEAALRDVDADALPDPDARERARARLETLVPGARTRLEAALNQLDTDELAAVTAYEVYAKFFETEEIRQLTAFFGSPTGRKLTALGPTINRESKRPGAQEAIAGHFSEQEMGEIAEFSRSPAGQKLHDTALDVRDAMHEQFMRLSEPAVQRLARDLADAAERGAGSAAASAPGSGIDASPAVVPPAPAGPAASH